MRVLLWFFWMLIVLALQVPLWLLAKLRGKSYKWWGGPQ